MKTYPFNAGWWSIGINGQNSSGTIDTWWLKIEKLNSSCGILETIEGSPRDWSSSFNDLAYYNLNTYVQEETGAPFGYFASSANQNHTYRVTLFVKNPCVETSEVGYFNTAFAGKRSRTDMDVSQIKATVYQTIDGSIGMRYYLPMDELANLFIYDMNGRLVKALHQDQYMTQGFYTHYFDDLAKGLYVYQLGQGDQVVNGKIFIAH